MKDSQFFFIIGTIMIFGRETQTSLIMGFLMIAVSFYKKIKE